MKIASITTLTVEDENGEKAINMACGKAWEYNADEIGAKVLEEGK